MLLGRAGRSIKQEHAGLEVPTTDLFGNIAQGCFALDNGIWILAEV